MKLKAVLALTATLMLGVAAAQGTASTTAAAPTLSDVPAGHWAKDAVDRLVSEGVILGFPDGTFRGTQNLTRYQAAVIIARVLDQIAQGTTSVSAGTDASLQNAVQELAADLAALGVRVADLEENSATKDDIARIEDRLDNLDVSGGDTGAADDLRSQLDDLTARVDELSGNYDALRADVDDNASSIAALNDLTVLLNQDILSLQDRVSALETGKADRADVDALASRVNTLEARPVVTFTGGFTNNNGSVYLTSGTAPFDIDRLTQTTFFGAALSGDDVTSDDIGTGNTVSNSLTFGIGVTNLKTATGSVIINNASVQFGVNNLFALAGGADTAVRVTGAEVSGSLSSNPFKVTYTADYSKFKFNDYMFANAAEEGVNRRGIVATIQGNTLPLSPAITVVTGGSLVPATTDPVAAEIPGNYFGVRASINPFGLGSLGLSYGSAVDFTGGFRNIFSADLNANVGPVAVDGVYVASLLAPGGFADRNQAFYTRAKAGFGVVTLGGSVRAVDPTFADGVAGFSDDGLTDDNNPAPFAADQFGYGVGASAPLFDLVTLGAYYDYRANYANTAGQSSNFGVSAKVNLPLALALTGFFNSTSAAGTGTPVSPYTGNTSYDQYTSVYDTAALYQGFVLAPYRFTSTFGAVLTHDGKAANAIVPGLNLTAAYANFYTIGGSDFQAFGDYTGTFGIVSIKPFARFHLNAPGTAVVVTDADTGATGPAVGYTTFKVGTLVSTTPADIFLKPSLDAGVSYRTTTFTSGAATTEFFGKVGVVANDIFGADSNFGVGYSFYSGDGVASMLLGDTSAPFSTTGDRVFASPPASVLTAGGGAATGTLNGVYAQLNLYGVKASYGIFSVAGSEGASTAQGFKLGYSTKF